MSSLNRLHEVISSAERPAEANGTNSNDPISSRIIPAKDERITILSADGTKVINGNEGFLDELAYHMDGPLRLNSNDYVNNFKSPTKQLRYSGHPTAITYQDSRSQVSLKNIYDGETPKVSNVFPFFISKFCSDPRTMVFNIKDMCYVTRSPYKFGEPLAKRVREELETIISDFKRFTSIESDMMNPNCGQKVKIVNNYDEFPLSKLIVSDELMIIPRAKLFLCDSITMSHNVGQIEEVLVELLRFVEGCENGRQLSNYENFEVEVSMKALCNGFLSYYFHSGKNYDLSLDQCTRLEVSVEHALRDIVLHGYSASNAHPLGLCRGVVMVPFIQNFKLVTTSGEEEENDFNRNIGQPPPYSQQ